MQGLLERLRDCLGELGHGGGEAEKLLAVPPA